MLFYTPKMATQLAALLKSKSPKWDKVIMQIIVCDRCGEKTDFMNGALERATIVYKGKGCVETLLMSEKDLCQRCRSELPDLLKKEIYRILNTYRTEKPPLSGISWQPIETAPTDGRDILVWDTRYLPRVVVWRTGVVNCPYEVTGLTHWAECNPPSPLR